MPSFMFCIRVFTHALEGERRQKIEKGGKRATRKANGLGDILDFEAILNIEIKSCYFLSTQTV